VRPTVLIVQRQLPHYRVAFFEALRTSLDQRGVTLRVAHGVPTKFEVSKQDGGTLSWSEHIEPRYFWNGKLCWLPYGDLLTAVDLVVVTPENKLIYNLLPQFFNRSVRFGFWGHGGNLQGKKNSWAERFKRWCAKHADWWFAYTDHSREMVLKAGFPAGSITVLNNSVDTRSMGETRRAISPEMQARLRLDIGLQGHNVGVYVGSFYAEKRIEFMLEAALRIRQRVPDFEFVLVGAGPQANLVTAFCEKHRWAHSVGAQMGADMVATVSLARVMLNPGAVGLAMVDSFACQVPLFTSNCGLHGPEIQYLVSGENAVMTPDSTVEFSDAVCLALEDPKLWNRLQAGCVRSASIYTMEHMVEQFVSGALKCLAASVRRRGLLV
jgi:L-malate glycosyltransferase